ncbi:tyrosine-protein kinase receptor torso-like [Leptidea sinapis]|uniref:tyrosine-protein kinase receptor torso-like n=1 Tax=Leptidea sinapis TaxID=189913 RepID=UPI0021C326D9|nr:tyrosine-protein kinase receptor torso-like [Leptidea sinapis]
MHFIFRADLSILLIMNCVLCVRSDTFLNLPASTEQLNELASSVCSDMFSKNAMVTRCKELFYSLGEPRIKSPAVEIKCQSERSVTFAVPPSQLWKLIVVLGNERSQNSVNYNLMEPSEEIGTIFIPPGNFTFWSTALSKDGSINGWEKGPEIHPWEEIKKNLEHREYIVNPIFLIENYTIGTYYISAELSWNNFDSTDSCFSIFNRCSDNTLGTVFRKKVYPNQNRRVIVRDLPLDDNCIATVVGKFGITEFPYKTPSCDDLPGCEPSPDLVKPLTLEAIEDSPDSWSVRVRWSYPKHPPSYYNVTLYADQFYTANITGNSTEVIFNGVRGTDMYSVSVDAINPRGRAVSSETEFFPERSEMTSLRIAYLVLWVLASVVVVVLAAMFIWWRRLNEDRPNLFFPEMGQKFSKDGEMDICSVDSASEDQWEVKPERLLLHEIIGEGAFGVVRRGTLAPLNKYVAVKMLKDFPSVEEIRAFRAEMEMMKSVGAHPHIVSLVGCCSGRKPLIVAEYCSKGDLLSYLRSSWDLMASRRNARYYNNNKEESSDELKYQGSLVINRLYDLHGVCDTELTLLDLLSYCRQIAMGMEFLASNRVVHRDLAARNVLVSTDGTLKIADFGLSRDIYQENHYKQRGNGKMPVKWMALESLTHRIYTTQSDVWSFGVVMWEVVTVGATPYPAVGVSRLPRLLRAGYRMPRPANCTPALYEVMSSCWNARPSSRPTFTALHRALDEMLCASAHHYLDLLLPDECERLYHAPYDSRSQRRDGTVNIEHATRILTKALRMSRK